MTDVDEYLRVYLAPPGEAPGIGPERIVRKRRANGIALFVSPDGSYRYIMFAGGEPIAVLQVVAKDKTYAVIANVYTAPEHRHSGYAALLLKAARRDFRTVEHAKEESLSKKGKAWRDRVR